MSNDNKDIIVNPKDWNMDQEPIEDIAKVKVGGSLILGIKTHIFYLPTSVMLPRKTKADKKVHLNMNQFINYSRFTVNDAKQLFKPISEEPFRASKIRISYFLEKKHKREFDTMNFVSIVDKFFLDWLVKVGYLPNDKFYNVCYGEIDGMYDCASDRVIATVEIIEIRR